MASRGVSRIARAACATVVAVSLLTACVPVSPPSPGPNSSFSTEPGGVQGTLQPTGEPFPLPVPANVYTDVTSPDRQDGSYDPNVRPPGMTDPPPGTGYDRYYKQKVKWGSCTSPKSGTQCAHVLAPLDWRHPDGAAITLVMKRRAATSAPADPASPDLFVNPGGPGASAQNLVDYFNTTGLTGFNIVGLDPRGSGESTPVVCGTTAELDAYFDLDSSPDDDAEKATLIDGTKKFAQQCRDHSGALLDHITTIDAVYDFDMVRQLLGDKKFNWLGYSYGTFIGAVYLELFPNNAGRMILDGAVNITENSSFSQAEGFEQALHKYAKWAATSGYGASEDAVIKKITDFATYLDGTPLKVGKRQLTQSLYIQGISQAMYYGADYYSSLASILQFTIDNNNGSYMLQLADSMNGRSSGGYDSMATAFPAIACADSADNGIDDSFSQWKDDSVKSPIFAYYWGPGLVCEVWTAKPAVQIDFRGADDPPFLVIGGTGDNATPYQYSQWMVQQMPAGILVTRDGVGHCSYGQGSSCIDKIVRAFLAKGTLPDAGVVCPMD